MRTATPSVRLSLSFAVVSTLLVVGIAAVPANDWSKPCFNGECAYELPKHSNSGLGVLKICGSGPFARIAAASLASNQDLPPHAVGKVVRRSGIQPVIHSFKIDTNFALVDVDKVGPVNFAFVGLTAPSPSEAFAHPDIDLNFDFVDGWPDDMFKSIASWAQQTTNVVTHAVTDAANTVAHAAETAGKAVAHVAGSAFQTVASVPGLLENATHFEFKPTVELAPVTLNGSATLIDYKPKGCPGGAGSIGGVIAGELKVDVAGTGSGHVKAGVIVDGSIVPPTIRDFAAYAGLAFDIDAQVTIKAAVLGKYESPKIAIIKSVGLPGFSIPGIITIGPMFELQGHAKAALDIKIDSVVHLAYKVQDLELWYPSSRHNATEKGIETKESPFKLKASAKASAKGYIEGHLVPVLKLGFEGFGSGASVYLEADAFARVSLSVDAHASANVKAGATPAPAAHPRKGKRDAYLPPYGHQTRSELALRNNKPAAGTNVQGHAKGAFSGCVWVDAGLELNFGAKADLGKIWNVDERGSLWKSPLWPIWSGCFAAGTKSASAQSKFDPSTLEATFKNHDLTCDADAGDLEAIPDEQLPANKTPGVRYVEGLLISEAAVYFRADAVVHITAGLASEHPTSPSRVNGTPTMLVEAPWLGSADVLPGLSDPQGKHRPLGRFAAGAKSAAVTAQSKLSP
ncbi:hypothetical protein EYR36_010704 [Pleurotus pulmonarius]|nr:hypothetical protein EYR36_010704 [Pleurotus pulmonarius]